MTTAHDVPLRVWHRAGTAFIGAHYADRSTLVQACVEFCATPHMLYMRTRFKSWAYCGRYSGEIERSESGDVLVMVQPVRTTKNAIPAQVTLRNVELRIVPPAPVEVPWLGKYTPGQPAAARRAGRPGPCDHARQIEIQGGRSPIWWCSDCGAMRTSERWFVPATNRR